MSPRKVRLVVDVVRGLDVDTARRQLKFMKKAAAEPVFKLLNSAVANAEHNFHLKSETLYIKTIFADAGPVLHRWTPRAFGRASPIRKRMTHLSLVLDERSVAPEGKEKSGKPAASEKKPAKAEKKAVKPKTDVSASKKSTSPTK